MADPASLGLMLFIGGSVAQAYSTYQEGKEQEKQYKMRAAIAAKEAEYEKHIAMEESREKRKEAKRLEARQITLYAKSGVSPGVGTPLLVRQYTQEQMERHARIIMEHGQFVYEQGMLEAQLMKKIGKSLRRAATWKAGSTLATTLGMGLMMTAKPKGGLIAGGGGFGAPPSGAGAKSTISPGFQKTVSQAQAWASTPPPVAW